MSGELEAAGAMATAGLVAGAIEGREAQAPGEGACLNCGAQLNGGAYCSACGQAAHPHRSLVHVLEEFLHGVFHFDTKVWRTLPMAIFRPGTLTRNYVYGKRARYLSPLAFFLMTVFFMFAVFAFTGGPPVNVTESGTVAEAQEELTEARADLATAQQELQDALAHPDPDQPAGLEERLARQGIRLAEAEVAREERALQRAQAREAAAAAETQDQAVVPPVQVGTPAPEDGAVVPPTPALPADSAAAPPDAGEVEADAATEDDGPDTWQDAARDVAESDDFVGIEGWDWFNNRIRQQLRNPDLAAYKVQEAAAKFSFLLVPISLPFIALLFLWKRGVTLYDHVVFSLYELSFVSLLFIAIGTLARVDSLVLVIPFLVLLGIPIHTFFHLKGAYALGWFSAIWRTFFMLIFASIALTLFLVTILIVGLVG
jgi:hypothetical protein